MVVEGYWNSIELCGLIADNFVYVLIRLKTLIQSQTWATKVEIRDNIHSRLWLQLTTLIGPILIRLLLLVINLWGRNLIN